MRLPPLDTLSAFDAAFAHRSFTRAGAVLYLTHGALSRRVSQLERDLGVSLFRRVARGLEPTPAGVRFHRAVRHALTEIGAAATALREEAQGGSRGTVRVSVLPSFGARWLLPRLAGFEAEHPEVDVELVADNRIVDLVREPFDLAIRYGEGHWPGVRSRLLLREDVFPVCAPSLATRFGNDGLQALANSTLLHDGERWRWQHWLRAASLDENLGTAGPMFNDYNLLVEAAANGLGIGFGRGALVAGDIASGRLVAPFPLRVTSDWSYHLVWTGSVLRPPVQALAEWIFGVAGAAEADLSAAKP